MRKQKGGLMKILFMGHHGRSNREIYRRENLVGELVNWITGEE